MGSSNLKTKTTSTKTKGPCLYTNLTKLDVTCEKTNKIDIDRYFQLMKDEVIKMENPDIYSNENYLRRSMSSGKIERKKKAKKDQRPKRSSCDVSALHAATREKDKSKERSHGCFSYDLSGQVVEVGEHKDADCDRRLSKQKSWDLSYSKVKGPSPFFDEEIYDNSQDDLVRSYSAGDFKDTMNNNLKHHSRSMESFDNLHARHRENAMVHGKIYSVSEQNRRLRRKYFRKEKANSMEKVNVLSGEDDSIEAIFQRKLALKEPQPVL